MSDDVDGRGEFVKAGYLVKSPPVSRAYVSQWHRRWFLLMDSRLVYPLAERYVRLVYYQSEADAKRLADPKGSINLNTCLSVVSSSVPVKNFKYVFDVSTTERVYHLAADSEKERSEWVSTLKELLFPSSKNGVNSRPPPPSKCPPSQVPEVSMRTREGSARIQRPDSFAANANENRSKEKGRMSPGVQQRPLPPVPGSGSVSGPSSPVEIKKRPLPAPPVVSSQGVRVNPTAHQTSPLTKRVGNPPPPKPSPYRNKSDPSPPSSVLKMEQPSFQPGTYRSASLSPPPSLVLAEEYQEFVSQSQPVCSSDHYEFGLELNLPESSNHYSFATEVSSEENNANSDYSVLEPTVPSSSSDQDYSRLEPVVNDSPPPPIRYSSLTAHHHHSSDTSLHKSQQKRMNQRPHSAIPDYVNYPSHKPSLSNDDYSRLYH